MNVIIPLYIKIQYYSSSWMTTLSWLSCDHNILSFSKKKILTFVHWSLMLKVVYTLSLIILVWLFCQFSWPVANWLFYFELFVSSLYSLLSLNILASYIIRLFVLWSLIVDLRTGNLNCLFKCCQLYNLCLCPSTTFWLLKIFWFVWLCILIFKFFLGHTQ